MFPRNNSNKKPIKLGTTTNKMKNMGAFIDNELKMLKNMKQRNNNITDNKPKMNDKNKSSTIEVNNAIAESQNCLKNSMSNKGFNSQKTIDDTMRMSQTKFEGFSNITKFTESNNVSQIIDKNESRRTRRPPSTASNKGEPFVIKFPQDQIQNKQTKDILKNLNKGMENEIKFRNNNAIENITGLKASNEKKDNNNKKPYIESYNKIADKPKNIFGDEEIEEDYGDFENVDAEKEKKK
jgi:hypothetical protein